MSDFQIYLREIDKHISLYILLCLPYTSSRPPKGRANMLYLYVFYFFCLGNKKKIRDYPLSRIISAGGVSLTGPLPPATEGVIFIATLGRYSQLSTIKGLGKRFFHHRRKKQSHRFVKCRTHHKLRWLTRCLSFWVPLHLHHKLSF